MKKKYRLSNYTRCIQLDENAGLLLNLLYKSADIISRELYDIIEISDIERLSEDILEQLCENGYVTCDSKEEEELRFIELVDQIDHNNCASNLKKPIAFIVSNKCNFSCPYCFEKTNIYNYDSLTNEQLNDIFNYIKKNINSVSHLELYGGEPLCFDNYSLVKEIVKFASEYDLKIHATTNGYELDQFAEFISPKGISWLQITLDGIAEYHDKRRIPIDGSPSFQKIVSNIHLALRKGAEVYIRANIDEDNINGLVPLIEFLEDEGILGNNKVSFNYICVTKTENYSEKADLNRAYVEKFLYSKSSDSLLLNRFLSRRPSFNDYINYIIDNPKVRYCGACLGNIFFSPEEFIYNCHGRVNNPNYSIGYFKEGEVILNDKIIIWDNRIISKLNNCRSCSLALVHGGGCMADIADSEKNALIGNCGSFCNEFDEYIRCLYSFEKIVRSKTYEQNKV